MIDVLNLEWSSRPSRDRIAATLVCNYLRVCGIKVVERSVFDGYHEINKLKPKIFFITNTIGAPENLEMMIYAKSRGSIGVSLISEGNFQGDSDVHQLMIWGWNKKKILHEDVHMQWTRRTKLITIKNHPELNARILVSGGVGFDNYIIQSSCPEKKSFFVRWTGGKEYQKIIGVGCWDFGSFYPEDTRYAIFKNLHSDSEVERFRKDGVLFDQVLSEVALAHPDILFLVKHHPGLQLGHKGAATQELSKIKNVIVLKDEISIYDSIALSDFWITYESTTAIEAWLLGRQTCLLNPSGRDFPRDNVNQGSPDFSSSEQLLAAIDKFYLDGNLPGFNQRDLDRRQVIKNTIGWDDGLNHVRAGNQILNLLEQSHEYRWTRESLMHRVSRWIQHGKWVASPFYPAIKKFRNTSAIRNNFSSKDLEDFGRHTLEHQLNFYQSRGLTLDYLRKVRDI